MYGVSGVSLQAYVHCVCSMAAESTSGMSISTRDNSQDGGSAVNNGRTSSN